MSTNKAPTFFYPHLNNKQKRNNKNTIKKLRNPTQCFELEFALCIWFFSDMKQRGPLVLTELDQKKVRQVS